MKNVCTVMILGLLLLSFGIQAQVKKGDKTPTPSHKGRDDSDGGKSSQGKSNIQPSNPSNNTIPNDIMDIVGRDIDNQLKNLDKKTDDVIKKTGQDKNIENNNYSGSEAEKIADKQIELEGKETAKQVTIRNSAGTARLDNVSVDKDGNIYPSETKSGNAKLNKNQENVYKAAETEGFEIRGNNAQKIGLPSGTKVEPKKVEIRRVN